MDYNLLIGGAAGQGMETLTTLLERMLKQLGYAIHTTHDYMSRVRGGHNFMHIRFGDTPLYAHRLSLDGIIALNGETVALHRKDLSPEGFLLADTSVLGGQTPKETPGEDGTPENGTLENGTPENGTPFAIPLKDLAIQAGNPKAAGTVALGAILRLFGLTLDGMDEVIRRQFSKEDIANVNIDALKLGYDAVAQKFSPPSPMKNPTHLINGNQAIALGALAAGCRFYSAYPMTPSTSVMTYLSDKMAATGILVEQAEDEIAAINMAIGASYAGVRAMTGTSGGGFCLKAEAIGLAGITETPLVALNVMRPGPATGLPTRTEQADLQFVIHAAQGEYPRMVIAVRNPADAYRQTKRAFALADKYQLPVILLSDQYLADTRQTIEPLVVEVDSGPVDTTDAAGMAPFAYKRYRLTESGISPRLIPGTTPDQIVRVDSDEHDEGGSITESAEVRNAMVEKRAKKLDLLRAELEEPVMYGSPDATLLLVAWGSMEGPVREALALLEAKGVSAKALVFGDVWPLPTRRITAQAATAIRVVNVEQNSTGQLALLIREATGIAMTHSVLRYDGRQLPPADIAAAVEQIVSKKEVTA